MKQIWTLVIFLIAGILVLIASIWPESNSQRSPSQRAISREEQDQRVNRHLLLTHKKIELAREQAQVQSAQIPKVGQSILPPSHLQDLNQRFFPPDESQNSAPLPADLAGRGAFPPPSARDQILSQQFRQEQVVREREASLRAYAREFIENARRAGFELEVDENFVVRRVTPLKGGRPIQTEFDIVKEAQKSK